MRSLLGVLRSASDSGANLTPQPGVEQLAELLEQTRAAGLPVSFAVEGVPRALPSAAALAAYRIVQESLTNARKHGGPTVTAGVTLRFCEDQLVITVTDDGRARDDGGGAGGAGTDPDGLGHGLIGMRERADVHGGTIAAGPRPGGGWRVTATLPLAPGGGAMGTIGAAGAVSAGAGAEAAAHAEPGAA